MKGLYATRTIPEGTELFTIDGPRVAFNVLNLQKNQFDVSQYAFETNDKKNVCVVLDPQGKPLNEDIPYRSTKQLQRSGNKDKALEKNR